MSTNVQGMKWFAGTLRAWHLAILRYAVTLDNADRLAVMAIANEIDRLGSQHDGKPDFRFFRRTSAELCAALLRPNEHTPTVLRQYLARIDDDRLKRVFAATIETDGWTVPGWAQKGQHRADGTAQKGNDNRCAGQISWHVMIQT